MQSNIDKSTGEACHYDEKSCGTILFTGSADKIKFLLIKSPDGHFCGFPKGHVEGNESEVETAIRETWEETSIRPFIIREFRKVVYYHMKNNRIKQVVYFLGYYRTGTPRQNSHFEKHDYVILPYERALEALTFSGAKELLREAMRYLRIIGRAI